MMIMSREFRDVVNLLACETNQSPESNALLLGFYFFFWKQNMSLFWAVIILTELITTCELAAVHHKRQNTTAPDASAIQITDTIRLPDNFQKIAD